jgi:hypothetical protein
VWTHAFHHTIPVARTVRVAVTRAVVALYDDKIHNLSTRARKLGHRWGQRAASADRHLPLCARWRCRRRRRLAGVWPVVIELKHDTVGDRGAISRLEPTKVDSKHGPCRKSILCVISGLWLPIIRQNRCETYRRKAQNEGALFPYLASGAALRWRASQAKTQLDASHQACICIDAAQHRRTHSTQTYTAYAQIQTHADTAQGHSAAEIYRRPAWSHSTNLKVTPGVRLCAVTGKIASAESDGGTLSRGSSTTYMNAPFKLKLDYRQPCRKLKLDYRRPKWLLGHKHSKQQQG